MQKKCGSCYFFVVTDEKQAAGNCFLKPPAVQMTPIATPMNKAQEIMGKAQQMQMLPVSIRPFVQTDHFCGEWEAPPAETAH